MPLYGESIALGPAGVSALNRGANGSSESNDRPKKDAGCLFPLPAGEGQGEGERDAANQDGRTNLASSTRPSPIRWGEGEQYAKATSDRCRCKAAAVTAHQDEASRNAGAAAANSRLVFKGRVA